MRVESSATRKLSRNGVLVDESANYFLERLTSSIGISR
jgi:hypothetical protein